MSYLTVELGSILAFTFLFFFYCFVPSCSLSRSLSISSMPPQEPLKVRFLSPALLPLDLSVGRVRCPSSVLSERPRREGITRTSDPSRFACCVSVKPNNGRDETCHLYPVRVCLASSHPFRLSRASGWRICKVAFSR